jgi:subtilisin family serine protease
LRTPEPNNGRKILKRTHLAAALAATLAMAVPAAATAQEKAPAPSGLSTKVTLITGDVVVVSDGDPLTRPGRGREDISFRSYQDPQGHLHVVPSDAERQVATGVLDARLFDISLLARFGYDDAHTDSIPLIVQSGIGMSTADAKPLRSIDAHTEKAHKNGGFWTGVRAASTTKVWLDGKVTGSLDRSATQVGAPQAWEHGHTGAGATVAVLDTGIDKSHPDLTGAVVEEQNFTDDSTADDLNGHGTHVASTITGEGKYRGIAPDAKVISGKVLNRRGGGQESWIIAGMEWAATKAEVVNMSLGGAQPDDGNDPMALALNRLTAQTGALFVVAAGNDGGQVSTPASADAALTVGAVDRDDKLAPFSSRGPRFDNNAIKPDITAPGVDIAAAKARNGQLGTPVDDTHVSMSGTSMASPHVAGAAAVLAAQHPQWKAGDLKAALMNSARPNPSLTAYEQGAGRLDVAHATGLKTTTAQGSVSLGSVPWPHNDDEPLTGKITYRNHGTEPVVLDLGVTDVRPAASGLFSVSPAKLTVPAGGTADATVTANTRVNVPDAVYGAAVVASDGTRVPIGVDKQQESYRIKLNFIGVDGKPTEDYNYVLVNTSTGAGYSSHDSSGTISRQLPKGIYHLQSTIYAREYDTVLAEPAIVLSGPAELTLDATKAVQPSVTVDRQEAKPSYREMRFTQRIANGTATWIHNSAPDRFRTLPTTTSSPNFQWALRSVLVRPDGKGGFENSPYQYQVQNTEEQRVPAKLDYRVRDKELARVNSTVHGRVPGTIGQVHAGTWGTLPFQLQEFYTPDVPWRGTFAEYPTSIYEMPLTYQIAGADRTFTRGKIASEHWNGAVFGPTLPYDGKGVRFAGRLGNQLRIDLSVFGAPGTHEVVGSPGRTVLTRDGQVLSDVPWAGQADVKVPPAKGTYQLHTEAARDSLSAKVIADWTFTSEHNDADDYQPVPLLAVTFVPSLDADNKAKAGSTLTVPVTVERNGTGSAQGATTPEIQVSYDEGRTWKSVRATKTGNRWSVTLQHPKDAKSVSLKAKTSDGNGSVDQTIIRAYDLK